MADDMEVDFAKLKVPDLKKELKSRGLSTSGNKNDLIERLQASVKLKMDDTASAASVDDLEEDLLNDDDDEHLDTSETVIQDLDKELDVSLLSQKRKSCDSENGEQNKTGTAKKIVLNRTSVTEENKTNGVISDKDTQQNNPERKVVKLSELSATERLEMRSKKFGVSLSTDAKKVARAERFNLAQRSVGGNVTTNIETLKKRAERFGGSVSTVMSKLETQDKLEMRKAKFGGAVTAPDTASNGSLQSEKAKQRLERFKVPLK